MRMVIYLVISGASKLQTPAIVARNYFYPSVYSSATTLFVNVSETRDLFLISSIIVAQLLDTFKYKTTREPDPVTVS